MSLVKSITEEYWTIQYLTNVAGERNPIFWPPDGEGKWNSHSDAYDAAENKISDAYRTTRVLHVTRTTEFGEPITDKENA